MNTLVRFLLLCALFYTNAKATTTSTESQAQAEPITAQDTSVDNAADSAALAEGRGLASSGDVDGEDPHAAFKKRGKPLKNIFMGIYKNYKSTYLGNKTSIEYKQRLRERLGTTPATQQQQQQQQQQHDESSLEAETETATVYEDEASANMAISTTEAALELETDTPAYDESEHVPPVEHVRKRGKRRRKYRNRTTPKQQQSDEQPRYNVGPGMNVSLDMSNDVINVKLDGENIKEIIAGRWLNDDVSEEARGKKYEMITKVLPLFILPFLIQSAIVPFLVTKLKLLLVKSILVGKLAVFLLIISAIKNSNKMMQTYEVAPSYWAGEPSRRTELAAAASPAVSSAAYNGYRVDGKPLTWIN